MGIWKGRSCQNVWFQAVSLLDKSNMYELILFSTLWHYVSKGQEGVNSLILAFPPNFSLSTQACGSAGSFPQQSKSTMYNVMHIFIIGPSDGVEVNFLWKQAVWFQMFNKSNHLEPNFAKFLWPLQSIQCIPSSVLRATGFPVQDGSVHFVCSSLVCRQVASASYNL